MNDLDVLERDQTIAHHAVEQRNEIANAFFGVDDLDQNGQIRREIENARRVHHGVSAETFDAFENGRAGKAALTRFFHNGGIERLTAAAIALTDKDAEELARSFELHRLAVLLYGQPGNPCSHTYALRSARCWPQAIMAHIIIKKRIDPMPHARLAVRVIPE